MNKQIPLIPELQSAEALTGQEAIDSRERDAKFVQHAQEEAKQLLQIVSTKCKEGVINGIQAREFITQLLTILGTSLLQEGGIDPELHKERIAACKDALHELDTQLASLEHRVEASFIFNSPYIKALSDTVRLPESAQITGDAMLQAVGKKYDIPSVTWA